MIAGSVGDSRHSPRAKMTMAAAKVIPAAAPPPRWPPMITTVQVTAQAAAASAAPVVRRWPASRRRTNSCAPTTVSMLAANARLRRVNADSARPGHVPGEAGLELAKADRHDQRGERPHPQKCLVPEHVPKAGPLRPRPPSGAAAAPGSEPGQHRHEHQERRRVDEIDGDEGAGMGDADHGGRAKRATTEPGVQGRVPNREHGGVIGRADQADQEGVLGGPDHGHPKAGQSGGPEQRGGGAREGQRGRADGGHDQAGHQRPPWRPPVGRGTPHRIADEGCQGDRGDDEAGRAVAELPDPVCVDEQKRQRQATADGGHEVTAQYHPRRARQHRDKSWPPALRASWVVRHDGGAKRSSAWPAATTCGWSRGSRAVRMAAARAVTAAASACLP